MAVTLSELEKALTRLEEALTHPKTDIVRDSVIQRFEFTIELSWKLLKKFLESEGLSDIATPKNVFREAGRLGLVDDVEAWMDLIDKRNLSSHTYNESLADVVYQSAAQAPVHVHKLVRFLKSRLNS